MQKQEHVETPIQSELAITGHTSAPLHLGVSWGPYCLKALRLLQKTPRTVPHTRRQLFFPLWRQKTQDPGGIKAHTQRGLSEGRVQTGLFSHKAIL